MSIRIGGNANITPDDLQWTYRGRKFGVELSNLGDMGRFISVVEVFSDGRAPAYIGPVLLNCELDDIEKAGGPMNWIKTTFMTWLRKTLAELFPPATTDTTLDAFQQVDKLLPTMVRINQNADGSVGADLI